MLNELTRLCWTLPLLVNGTPQILVALYVNGEDLKFLITFLLVSMKA